MASSTSRSRMVREILARRPGGHLVEAGLDRLDLRLALPLKGPAAEPEAFSRDLAARRCRTSRAIVPSTSNDMVVPIVRKGE